MIRYIVALGLALLASLTVRAQQTAREKIVAGAALVDQGKYDEALVLLKEGAAMEPDNYHWAYEVAFAYYSKKDFRTATTEYEKVVKMPGADAQCYAMLGNCYDYQGDSAKARSTYEQALKKFPKSGFLWVELGNLEQAHKAYNAALKYYESGIKADPGFAPSYYRAAKLYLSSNKKVWGMIYGEVFMNLERNSARTAEISKLIYDTYVRSIHIESDTSISVAFEDNVIDANALVDESGKIVIPFAMKVYEPNMLMATLFSSKQLDVNGLVQIRKNFLEQYYSQKQDKDYPNVLLAYQKRVTDAGHAEAYHHWILMKGDEAAFAAWAENHQNVWKDFLSWFATNELSLDEAHPFVKN